MSDFRCCCHSAGDAYKKQAELRSPPLFSIPSCHLTIYIQLTSPTSTPMSDAAPGHSKSSMDGTTINFNSAKGQNEPLPIPENNELDRYVTDDLPRQPRMAPKPQVPDAIMVNIACFGHSYRRMLTTARLILGRAALEEERDATLLRSRSWHQHY